MMKIRPGWLEVDVRKVPGWAAKVMQKRPSFLEILFEICWAKPVIAFVVHEKMWLNTKIAPSQGSSIKSVFGSRMAP